MSVALGPVTRSMTRNLYALINMRKSWCHTLTISPEATAELLFWLEQIDNFNGQNIWHSPSAIRVVYSDASSSGYRGYLVEHGCHIAHGQWLPEERIQSSTWRELNAVHKVLDSVTDKLANQRIRWFTDGQNVVRILNTGSKNPLLQQKHWPYSISQLPSKSESNQNGSPGKITNKPILSAVSLTTMIGAYIQHCLKFWTRNGDRILLTGLPVISTPNYQDLILDSGTPAQREWTLLHVTGGERIIGGAHQCT